MCSIQVSWDPGPTISAGIITPPPVLFAQEPLSGPIYAAIAALLVCFKSTERLATTPLEGQTCVLFCAGRAIFPELILSPNTVNCDLDYALVFIPVDHRQLQVPSCAVVSKCFRIDRHQQASSTPLQRFPRNVPTGLRTFTITFCISDASAEETR
jgi:hypothetical protein